MEEKTKETLLRFIDKADKLLSLSFTKTLQAQPSQITLSWNKENPAILVERKGPDEEAIDAFVPTFRFFIQKNEPISFRALEDITTDPALSAFWVTEYKRIRKELNEFLDSPIEDRNYVFENEKIASNRELMDTFIYGDLAHNSPGYEHKIQRWKKEPILFELARFEFIHVLGRIFGTIFYMAEISRKELEA